LAAALVLGALGSVMGHGQAQKTEPKPGQPTLTDALGDPLPAGAVLRLGSLRLNQCTPVYAIAWFGDGKRLISAGYNPVEQIRQWDAVTGNEIAQLLKQEHGIRQLVLSSDGKIAGATDFATLFFVWEPATGKVLLKVYGIFPNSSVALAADGKSFAVIKGKMGVAYVQGIGTAEPLKTFGDDAYQLDLSPDGKTLATANRQKGIHLWEVATGKLLNTLEQEGKIRCLRFAADGKGTGHC